MAKNVTKNHVINTEEESYEFEDLIETEEDKKTEIQDEKETETEVKKSSAKVKENILILKGAASYLGCGLKFIKNVPTPVKDKTICEKLLLTGLFVNGNE